MNRNRVKDNLVALGSAAVLTVYAAGFVRTRSAAQRFAVESNERRAPVSTAKDAPIEAPPTETNPPATAAVEPTSPEVAPPASPVATRPKPDSARKAAPEVTPPADSTPTPAVTQAADSVPQTAGPQVHYRDGVYTGWGTSRHGDIQASVEIKDGRIVSASIKECLTRYSCSWIEELPGQVVTRQSPETDYVSGATQSTNAFYYAVVQALSKAK